MKKLLLLTGLFFLFTLAYSQPRHKVVYADTFKLYNAAAPGGVYRLNPTDTIWNANKLRGRWIGTTTPADSDFLYYHAPTGTLKWRHEAQSVGTLAAGVGITVNGSTVTHTAHTGDATGTTSLTVVQLQGRPMVSTAPTSNSVLYYDGANWTPGYPYSAGTGITISSNSFTHTAHTGDATGTTSLTVVQLQGRTLAATAPTINSVLAYQGTSWQPVNPANFWDSMTHVKLGKTFYKTTTYISPYAAKSGGGTVYATNLAGDTVDYAMFIFKKSGRISFIANSSNFDTLGTRSKLIMNDTSGWRFYIKNNLGVYRNFLIEYSYR